MADDFARGEEVSCGAANQAEGAEVREVEGAEDWRAEFRGNGEEGGWLTVGGVSIGGRRESKDRRTACRYSSAHHKQPSSLKLWY